MVGSLLMGPRRCSGTWGTTDFQVCYWAAATGFGFSSYRMGYFTHCCEIFSCLEIVFKQPAQQLHSSSYPSRKSLKEEARSPGLAGPVAEVVIPDFERVPATTCVVSTGFGTSWNSS